MQKKIGMWNNKMQLNIKILQKKTKKGINLKQNQKEKRKKLFRNNVGGNNSMLNFPTFKRQN